MDTGPMEGQTQIYQGHGEIQYQGSQGDIYHSQHVELIPQGQQQQQLIIESSQGRQMVTSGQDTGHVMQQVVSADTGHQSQEIICEQGLRLHLLAYFGVKKFKRIVLIV